MTQLAALSHIEQSTLWTANNVVNSYVSGDFTVREMHELELAYPGHFGQGAWILTGEVRITDLDNFGGCDIHLYNEFYDSTYGITQGYTYDTAWKSFSIFSGWMSDLPSTMILMIRLYTTTGELWDIVELRNVQLSFVQFNDSDGMNVIGRDYMHAGFHAKRMTWDYSAYAAQSIAPGASNTVFSVVSANGMSNTTSYVSFLHINGFDNFGGQDESMKTWLTFQDGSTASNTDGIAFTRPLSGYYPSYTWMMNRMGNTSITTSVVAHNDATSANNMQFDIYGGWFMMMLEKANTDIYLEYDAANTAISGNTLAYSANLNSNTSAMTRYLVLAAGRHNVNTGNVISTLTLGGSTIGQYECFDYYGAPNSGHFASLTNMATPDSATLTLNHDASAVGATGGPLAVFAIPVDRDYINSTSMIANSSTSGVSGTRSWSNRSNLYSANVTHWAFQSPSVLASNNHYLKVTGFGFDQFIPADSEIGYVWMYPVCRRAAAYGGGIVWDDIKMVASNTAVGSSVAWATAWATDWMYDGPAHNFGVSTYWSLDNTPAKGGTPTRNGLWNYKPTAAEVRAANFGFQMRCRAASGNPMAQIAYVAAVVYYRAPGETFMRSITASADTISMNSELDRGIYRLRSAPISSVITSKKEYSHLVELEDVQLEQPVSLKATGQNRLALTIAIPSRLSSSIEAFSTVVSPVAASSKRFVAQAPRLTSNISSSVISSMKAASKNVRAGLISLIDNRNFQIEQDIKETSATTTSWVRKSVGKRRSAGLSVGLSRVVAVSKSGIATLASSVSNIKQIARSVAASVSMSAVLNNIKNTRYYISDAITQTIIPSLNKAIAPASRATNGLTMLPSLVFTFGVAIGGFISMSMSASAAAKHVGSNKLAAATSTVRRLVGINRSEYVVTSTIMPSSQKSVEANVRELSSSLITALNKSIGKTRARSITVTIQARKAVVAASAITSDIIVEARKALSRAKALASTLSTDGSKAIVRVTKRGVAAIVRWQKASVMSRVRSVVAVVKSRRATGSFFVAPVSVVVSARKAISHSFSRVAVGVSAELVTRIQTLLRKLHFTFRELGFSSLVSGLSFKFGDSTPASHEQVYADLEIIQLGEPEVFEARLITEPNVTEATISNVEVIDIK